MKLTTGRQQVPTLYFSSLVSDILKRYPHLQQPSTKTSITTGHIALLPGSRKNELQRHLPLLIESVEKLHQQHPQLKFSLLKVDHLTLQHALPDCIKVYSEKDHDEILAQATLAIVCSGTATLECAAYQLPMIVFYQLNPLSYWLITHIIKLNCKYITLVNILADQLVVPELIQNNANADNLVNQTVKLLTDSSTYNQQKKACLA